MVENGMLVGADRYDPQMRKPKTAECAACGQDVPICDGVRLGGGFLCGDCLPEFCGRQFPTLGQDYLQENQRRYEADGELRSDSLYLNWWFENLEKPDRLRVLQAAYRLEAASIGGGYCREWERDYCLQADDWQEFVMERLGAL